MKEATGFQTQKPDAKQGLTNTVLTGYSRFKNNMQEAVAEVATVTKGPTVGVPESPASPKPNTEEIEQQKTLGVQPDSQPKDIVSTENTTTEKPQKEILDITNATDAAVRKIEGMVETQEYQEIVDRITAEAKAKGEVLSPDKLHILALEEYVRQEMEKTTSQTKKQQEGPLSEEQKMAISKTLKSAFKENPDEMSEVAKKAINLAKAEAREVKLNEKPNVTDKQKTKASETTTEQKKQYASALQKLNEALGGQNPQLIKYLQEVPGNPDILKLLKKEKRGSLFKMFMELMSVLGLSAVTDIADDVSHSPEQ